MNIYALIPLVATMAYVPLLIITASARPWGRRQRLFFIFLVVAFLYSLADVIFRGNFFPQYSYRLVQIIIFFSSFLAVQFHCFTSFFFPSNKGRWLPFAYSSLVLTSIPLILGILPQSVEIIDGRIYAKYGIYILFEVLPLIVLLARNLYVFIPRLKNQNNPVIYNQIVSIILSLSVLTFFMLLNIFPTGSEIPLGHAGNICIALILTFAVVRHHLVDIRFVLRRGIVWLSVSLIGLVTYWGLLLIFHAVLKTELTFDILFASSLAGILAAAVIFITRNFISRFASKALQGESYVFREKLLDFSNKIQNVFNWQDQGCELLSLVTQAINCRKAGLLFADPGEDYITQIMVPSVSDNALQGIRIREDSPIVEYLKRERRPLTRENLAILPEFLSLWQQEKNLIDSNEIEVLVPLISREKLIGIMILDKKKNGHYNLEDFGLLEDIAKRVSVSMEKEFIREQLKERQEELSVINRSNAIFTSSFDIQRIYDNFIKELKRHS